MKKQGLIIYCDYCQHPLNVWGFVCHDSKTETNFYGNYFIIKNSNRKDYLKEKISINQVELKAIKKIL